ncbi:MFS transporter [Cognatishimia maritima]|uniref:Predicted arabinose efflux permease, MFS family n=1 Tax=Cognatishimia maritima TaxID=870908 RepID=A0A1M5IX60_9RHOB|nr:MFS transporter [Cognatishimia maritima]SHG32886.1 Predicted arabinose efflux permease, MFS family [Cognatishimia maritima]
MILLLMVAVGLIGANSLILSPIASEVAAGLGLENAADVMTAAAAYGAGVSISALLLAPLADRIGADIALKHSLILIAAALGISAAAPNMDFLIASQALAGVGVGLALPSIYTMAAVISVPGQEARTIGKVLTGWTLAMVGGVTFSAYIAEFFGWRMVFSILAIAVFAVLTFMYAVQIPAAPRSEKITSPISAMKVAGLGGALFCVAMFGAGFYGVYNYLGAHITDTLGRSVSDSGQFTLLYGLGFGLAMFFDRYLDRVGPKRAMAVIFAALIVLFAVAYQIVHSYTLFAALMFIWGIINHFGLNMTVNRLNQLDPSQRGAIMGLNSAVMYLCIFVATIGFRPLFDTWGLGACIMVSGIMAILGLGEALYARRIVKRTFLTKELI